MNLVKKFLGDTSKEHFTSYDTIDEAKKHVSMFGYDDVAITEKDIENLQAGKALVCHIMDEYSVVMCLENNENHT